MKVENNQNYLGEHHVWEYKRGFWLLAVILIGLFLATIWLAFYEQNKLNRAQAINTAKHYTNVLVEMQKVYVAEVVAKTMPRSEDRVPLAHDYQQYHAVLPIPTTLRLAPDDRGGGMGASANIALYSPYVFPGRKDGALQDDFARDAWQALNSHPNHAFFRFAEANGQTVLRYASARTIQSHCVNCHNDNPRVPPITWRVGDVLGVLEVAIVLGATSNVERFGWVSWILPGFVAALLLLVFFFRKLQNWTEVLEERVEERTAELADQIHRYRLLFNTSPVGIVVINAEAELKYWNPAFQDLFGYDSASLRAMTVGDITHVDEWGKNIGAFKQLIQDPSEVLQIESRYLRKDGRVIWAQIIATVLQHYSGFIDEIFVIVEDITQRREAAQLLLDHRDRLEKEVEGRTAELQATNQELEAFCYSVSHDLRAPLRGINGFSEALVEDYGEQLDSTAQHYLTRIRAGTQRMGMLIDKLLQLSRVGRQEMTKESVNLSRIANMLVEELRDGEPDRVVDCAIAEDLLTLGDKQLLSLALQNLIGNAWKFTSKAANASIEVGCVSETADEAEYFYVRDNGAGFDMKYREKLFIAFQRLHTEREFSGTGVGLSIVHKIVQRHGGRIWVESAVGVGTTFRFTLFETPISKLFDSSREDA